MRLDQAEQQISQSGTAAPALAAAEALVVEAEQLATGTPIDDAQPCALAGADLAVRTPALTRRFEAHCSSSSNVAWRMRGRSRSRGSPAAAACTLHEAEQALAAGHCRKPRRG
jgi:hypothetical protein